jgi:hypothetical protein
MIITTLIMDPADPLIKGKNSIDRNMLHGHANLIDIIQLPYIIYLAD